MGAWYFSRSASIALRSPARAASRSACSLTSGVSTLTSQDLRQLLRPWYQARPGAPSKRADADMKLAFYLALLTLELRDPLRQLPRGLHGIVGLEDRATDHEHVGAGREGRFHRLGAGLIAPLLPFRANSGGHQQGFSPPLLPPPATPP